MFMAQASIWKVAIVGVCVWDRYSEEYVLHWRALVPVRRAEMRPEVRLLDPQRLAAGPADAGGGHFHVHPQRRVGPRGWDRKHTHTHSLTLSLHTSLFHSLSLSLITLYCLSSILLSLCSSLLISVSLGLPFYSLFSSLLVSHSLPPCLFSLSLFSSLLIIALSPFFSPFLSLHHSSLYFPLFFFFFYLSPLSFPLSMNVILFSQPLFSLEDY